MTESRQLAYIGTGSYDLRKIAQVWWVKFTSSPRPGHGGSLNEPGRKVTSREKLRIRGDWSRSSSTAALNASPGRDLT